MRKIAFLGSDDESIVSVEQVALEHYLKDEGFDEGENDFQNSLLKNLKFFKKIFNFEKNLTIFRHSWQRRPIYDPFWFIKKI